MSDEKKKNLPKDLAKALEGFEDILDLIDDPKLSRKKVSAKDGQEGVGMYHFLESELGRLKNLDQFFSNIDLHLEGAQAQSIRNKLKETLALEKDSLVARLCHENSPFLQYMETLWDTVYKPGDPKV